MPHKVDNLKALTGTFSGIVTATTFAGNATTASSAGYAGSAGTLSTDAFVNRLHTYSTSYGLNQDTAALEIREYNLQGSAGGNGWQSAPRIAFHWAGRVQAQLLMDSGGTLVASTSNGGVGTFRSRYMYVDDDIFANTIGLGGAQGVYPLSIFNYRSSVYDNTYYSGNPVNYSVNVNPDNGGGYNYTGFGSRYGWRDNSEIGGDANDAIFAGSYAYGLSIFARGGIYTRGAFISASDNRIKSSVEDIDDEEALNKLRQLKPKTYVYKDKRQYGFKRVYGFIAQEVAETLPYAVKIDPDLIPNILETCNVSTGNIITMVENTTSSIELNQHKDGLDFCKIHLFNEKDELLEANVIEIVDEYNFKVDIDLSEYSNVFVYGQEVEDFHKLNKGAIFTIATAALQEVDRQQQADKLRIAELETQLASVLARLDALEGA